MGIVPIIVLKSRLELRFFTWTILLCFFAAPLFGSVLFGTLTDEGGKPLAFANVYVFGTTKGTTTNPEGKYQLELEPGKYEIVFNYIGYSKKTMAVEMVHQRQELNVTLALEDILIKEVVVSAKEDPAYEIIRRAIAKRQFHYDEVESYRCMAYTKGLQRIVSAPEKIFGQTVNFDGSLDSNNAGIIYLSESISELSFKKPDRLSETVISSKVSGNSQAFSWNRAGDFYIFNFYRNNIRIEFLSDRVFISPIADNAMLHYRYRLEGYFTDNGKLVNKIAVMPRRTNDPVFSGTIYIVEDDWNIHSLDLFLTKNNQMKFLDTLWVKQVYAPVNESVWMQLSQWFEFNFNILGIKAEGYFGIVYSEYEVNVPLTKKDFSNEVLRVDEEANKRDSLYWEQYRPIPLTKEEQIDYTRKDSLEELRQSRDYLRSVDKKANKFNAWDLVLGYNYQNSYKKLFVNSMPYIEGFQYNTVEGFNLKLKAEVIKNLSKERSLSIEPVARYGFSNQHFNGKARVRYDYQPVKNAYAEIEGGRYVYQFNRNEPISELINTFYSLFIGRNYLKIFEESFFSAKHRFEPFNGLMFWAGGSYGFRRALQNTSSVSVKDVEKEPFTENIAFESHEAFILSFSLQYRPKQRYISRPHQKINLGTKYPVFTLSYRKSIPGVFGSDLNFDFLEFRMTQPIPMGLFGNSSYSVRLGTFLNDNRVELMDFKHFNGNQTVFGINYREGFQLLDYYAASTTGSYAEAHFQHNFDGFFFNKIPGFRRLKFQEVFNARFLYTKNYGDYTELSVGIENILRVMRMDFVFGLSSRHATVFGFRAGIDFRQL